MDLVEGSGWYAVRCIFRSNWPAAQNNASENSAPENRYEERITVWKAASADEAIAKAEQEAKTYAAQRSNAPDEYLQLAQAHALSDDPSNEGAEVFSLIRTSRLDPEAYLDTFFDTGAEHQNGWPD